MMRYSKRSALKRLSRLFFTWLTGRDIPAGPIRDERIYLLFPALALTRMALTIVLVTLLAGRGCAQEGEKDTSATWDLETCIRYAREHNIALRRRELDRRTSEQELILARAARTPDLYATATQFLDHSNTAGAGRSQTYGSGEYGLNSTWTLFRGGYLKRDIRQKDLQVSSAELAVLQSDNDMTLQIIQQYLNALLDKESIVYARSLVSTAEAQVDQARQKLAAGSIARKDLMQLEAQLANDQYLLISSENAQRQDLIGLKQLLQLPSVTHFDIAVMDPSPTPDEPESLSSVQEEALGNRPEMKNAQLGIAIANAGLAKAKAGYMPTLTFSGSIGSRYAGASPAWSRQISDNFGQQAGITLSVPIFTRRLNAVNLAEARIGIEQAQLNLTDTRTILSLAIERIYHNLISAQHQFKAATASFNYNNETYRVAVEQLQNGLINMVEFLQQKALFIQSQQQFLQAKYTAALTHRIYDFYKGKR